MTTTTELKYTALNPYIFSSSNYSDKISKEELNETLKEEIIKTSNKDETQADISGSRQVDSGKNQNQATD